MQDARQVLASAGREAGRFFTWWSGELFACLPARLRALIVPAQSILMIEILKDGELRFSHVTPEGKETLATVRPRGGDDQASEELKALSRSADSIIVSLPETCGMRRRVELPAAARENLREVVAIEMDRLTPFKSDEIYFQIGNVGVGRTKELIALDLTVVPRALADDAVRMASGLGVEPDRLSLGEPAPDGANHVALDASSPLRAPTLVSRGFALAAALLIAAIVVTPFAEQARLLAHLEEAVAKSGRSGGESPHQKVAFLAAGARKIDQWRSEKPFTVALLDEVTRALPKGTFLSTLEISETKVSLAGLSDNAAALLGTLEQLDQLSRVQFDEAVAADDRFKKERFRISAAIAGQSRGVPR